MPAPNPSERELFDRALEFPRGADASAWLRTQCPDDPALVQRVLALIESAHAAETWLPESPVIEIMREKPGDIISRWRLEKVIGQGGFGMVWAADQLEPVRRRVALKILKAGVDTEAVIARFETERQALAMMDHPGVARVLDAGSTASGRPYFVMDLLEGAPILPYAAAHRLSIRERVELARQVAAALQHAHQRGIIHRDLKASNILVVETDGAPVVKVIDFGIARLMSETAAQVTLAGQQWGTPAWMSPEQLAGQPVDVRTDVFSLGLILFELLTGHSAPREAAAARETSIPLPSRSLQKLPPGTLLQIAAERALQPGALAGSVRGELDWIVQRATAAEPALRYESAAALRDDLAAWLSGEAVAAGPPSFAYQTRKFIRRHRGKLAAGALAACLLLAGTVVSLFYARRAHAAEASTREALYRSLLTEARALRQTGRPGQRLMALEAIAAAARIRPSRELQDEAVAAMALPDFRTLGQLTLENLPATGILDYAFDGDLLIAGVRTDTALQRRRFLDAAPLPPVALPFWSADVSQISLRPDGSACLVLLDSLRHVPLGLGIGMFHMDTGTGALHGRIGGVDPADTAPVFFDQGRRAAVVLSAGGIALWDMVTGTLQRRVMENYKVQCVASDDVRGRLLVLVHGNPCGYILPWEGDAQPAPVPLSGTRFCAALAADGRLAVAGGSGVTATFDPAAAVGGHHSFAAVRPGHTDATTAAGIAGGGQYVITGGWDELVRISTPSLEQRVVTPGRVRKISPAGDRMLLQNGDGFTLLETVLPEEFPTVSDWVPLAQRRVTFSHDGQWAAISTMTRPATSIGTAIPPAASGTLLLRLPGLQPAALLGEFHNTGVFSRDGSAIWSTGNGVAKWSTTVPDGPGPIRERTPLAARYDGLRTKSPVLSADGSLLALSCQERGLSVRIQKTSDGSKVLTIPIPGDAGDVEDVVMDPQGRWVAASYWRGTGVDVWSVPEGQKLQRLLGDREFLRLSLSADGSLLLVTERTTLHLWQTTDWTSLLTIPVQTSGDGPPHSALSPRGDRIAWDAGEGRVHIASPAAPQPHLTLRLPLAGKFADMAFSPDGEMLAVSSCQDTWFCNLPQVHAHLKRLGL